MRTGYFEYARSGMMAFPRGEAVAGLGCAPAEQRRDLAQHRISLGVQVEVVARKRPDGELASGELAPAVEVRVGDPRIVSTAECRHRTGKRPAGPVVVRVDD